MDTSTTHRPQPVGGTGSGTLRFTVLCLLALAAGVAGGTLAAGNEYPGAGAVAATAEAVVRAWTNAFRLLVAPLVMAQLYLAINGERLSRRDAGRLGLLVPAVFMGMLVVTAVLATFGTLGLLRLPMLRELALERVAGAAAETTPVTGAGSWVDGFIPPNLVAAATTDNILPLMLFAAAFAVAVRRADVQALDTITGFSRGVSQACFTMVGWLLRLTPLVILALTYRAARASGLEVGGVVVAFAGLEIAIVLALVLLLYPAVALLAGVRTGALARALWPAQLAAVTTRSSLATLPALFQGASTALALRRDTAAYVLPLAGATLKLSRAVTGPAKVLFLGHILGIPLGAEQLLIFTITIILLSASTVGVPTVTSGNRSLPAYVAAGIPAEYVVLLGVTVSLTDMFLTLLNTSGYLSAAAIVDRFRGVLPAPAGAPAAEPAGQPTLSGDPA